MHWINSFSRTRLVEPQGQSLLELEYLSTFVSDGCEYGADSVSHSLRLTLHMPLAASWVASIRTAQSSESISGSVAGLRHT